MNISAAVAASLEGDGLLTGRDAKGPFVIFDCIEYVIGAGEARLFSGDVLVSTIKVGGLLAHNDTIILRGLEGRSRLTIG